MEHLDVSPNITGRRQATVAVEDVRVDGLLPRPCTPGWMLVCISQARDQHESTTGHRLESIHLGVVGQRNAQFVGEVGSVRSQNELVSYAPRSAKVTIRSDTHGDAPSVRHARSESGVVAKRPWQI